MFTQTELDRLITAMRTNGVTSLEVETPDQSLQLDLDAAIIPNGATLTSGPTLTDQKPVTSPCVGRFMPRGEDDGLPPFAAASLVNAGDTLGYIFQGTGRVLVIAPSAGRLASDLPQTGAVFGYGDPIIGLESTS